MLRCLIGLFAIGLLGLMMACDSTNNNSSDENKLKDTFTGTIELIEGQNATVDISSGEILKSGRKVRVDLSIAQETTFRVGDEIEVGYEGDVRESGPLGINTTYVRLIK